MRPARRRPANPGSIRLRDRPTSVHMSPEEEPV
jgi:hypothetical protein